MRARRNVYHGVWPRSRTRARGAGLTVPSVTYSTLTMKGLGGVLLTPPTLVILCESDVLWGTLLVYNYTEYMTYVFHTV